MKIAFDERAVVQPGFTAFVADGVLRLPVVFQPLCEAQGITEAEELLAFARNKDQNENGRVTLTILVSGMDEVTFHHMCDNLESIIRSEQHKSEDLTPTAPRAETETPTLPGVTHVTESVATLNETAAAE